MKKLIAGLAALFLIGCSVALVLFFSFPWIWKQIQPSSEDYLDQYILTPTPNGTKVNELSYHTPVFGSMSLSLELELTDEGMKDLLSRSYWKITSSSNIHRLQQDDRTHNRDNNRFYTRKIENIGRVEMIVIGNNKVSLYAGSM